MGKEVKHFFWNSLNPYLKKKQTEIEYSKRVPFTAEEFEILKALTQSENPEESMRHLLPISTRGRTPDDSGAKDHVSFDFFGCDSANQCEIYLDDQKSNTFCMNFYNFPDSGNCLIFGAKFKSLEAKDLKPAFEKTTGLSLVMSGS